jgi:hypothetical protein
MRVSAFASALLVITAFGCTTDVANDGPTAIVDTDNTAEGAVTYQAPLTVPSDRMYYGTDAFAVVSDDAPSHFFHFDLLPDGVVDVVVDHQDGRRRTGMRVYRVNPTGSLRFLGELTGRGDVAARVSSRAGGTIVVEAFGTYGRVGAELTVSIACARRDDQCAVAQQPGELCGTRGSGACDEGLFCNFPTENECGVWDGGGSCAIPVDVCPRGPCLEVCGCDGQTYCDACSANAAGVSVASDGACEPQEPVCDPSVYELVKDDQLNVFVHGTWLWHGTVGFYDVESELRLNDGDFSYEAVHNPTCLHADPPCRAASRYFWMDGGWEQSANSVQLLPDTTWGPAPEALAQAFTVVQNCEGDLRLRTTEEGDERDFIRDFCADLECEDGQHCALEQMMCIRAPCPPMPICVDD